MIRVFIIDDHAIVRAGLRRLLTESSDIEVVGDAGSAEEALAALADLDADVVLLDLALPGMSGLEALPLFRQQRPDVRVLALSMYSEEQYALRVFQAGADGFISKSSVIEELLVALRRVAAGRKYVGAAAAERLAENLQQPPAISVVDLLSPRELETLRLIASGETAREIAGRMGVSTKTVGTFRYRLLAKLKLRNNVEVAHFATEHGLL
jgi:two-component system, NarL family, invasion response regulator UvrY